MYTSTTPHQRVLCQPPDEPLLAELTTLLQANESNRQRTSDERAKLTFPEHPSRPTEEWNRWYLDYLTNATLWKSGTKPLPTPEWNKWYLNYLSQAAFPDDIRPEPSQSGSSSIEDR